ncbi:type I-C CRISPR-associated protein Cas5 [Rhodobacteraceae bacterium RKSG542]|uniref:type I-C CRISPR-associated protein Cas5c n=1 Tax=Pseudovibrio flavus TaxID=2529854 RepID=UPI0012BBD324|nr:type I-C CRISPR-associated protein Cas5c [Pseudovibrio flavus]MTI15920.1 type I-C CRISPR-associated protein Cas5 [Pseudovibrio flavus]
MSFGVKLKVWGDYACFTRPEMKVERVSYDVITPSAARGILEAIHWKPAIRWVIDKIHVLEPVRFENIRKNEVGSKIPATKAKSAMKSGQLDGLHMCVDENRQQRATLALKKVAYVIEAHFEMTGKAGPDDNPAKHLDTFRRRAEKGQCFHRPCLGLREFVADFELLEELPQLENPQTNDLGWMLYDIDFARDRTPLFFRAQMTDGVIDVAAARDQGMVR